MLKICVIGSVDTVDKIIEVSEEFKDIVEFNFLKYLDKEETSSLTKIGQKNADIILYSGKAPYSLAVNSGVLEIPSTFVQRNGTGLYRCFWKMREDNISFNKMSVEAITKKDVSETARELNITVEQIFVKEMDEVVTDKYDVLKDFHLNLWKRGKTNVAITGFSKIYRDLNEIGIPCYRVLPTKSLIRNGINKAIALGEVEKAKNTQTAVQVIRIRFKNENKSRNYDFDLAKNKLERILIQYTRDNLGALYPNGTDEYMIFSNKGSIKNKSNYFYMESELFKKYKNIIISTGIGYGDNVKEAEDKARVALDYSIEKDYNCLYLIDNNNSVTGPISNDSDQNIEFSLSAGRDDKIREISEKTSLSPVYISKLKNLMEKLDKNNLDAITVKDYLGISERSARRILNTLVESGTGEVKYTESKAKTGRPRKIYEIKF